MNQLSILDIGFVVSRYGDEKLLLQLQRKGGKSKISVPMIGQAILDRNLSNLENLVASETELLIYCKPQYQEKLINDLIITKATDFAPSTSVIELDVCFELSLDWERVCGFLEKEKETIIKLLIKSPYKLINYGFQPGFMYLDGLKKNLHMPRLDSPRLQVPKGSIALGGKYLGVYGSASPGGWNIIGRSSHIYEDESDLESLPRIGQELKINRLNTKEYLRKHKNG